MLRIEEKFARRSVRVRAGDAHPAMRRAAPASRLILPTEVFPRDGSGSKSPLVRTDAVLQGRSRCNPFEHWRHSASRTEDIVDYHPPVPPEESRRIAQVFGRST